MTDLFLPVINQGYRMQLEISKTLAGMIAITILAERSLPDQPAVHLPEVNLVVSSQADFDEKMNAYAVNAIEAIEALDRLAGVTDSLPVEAPDVTAVAGPSLVPATPAVMQTAQQTEEESKKRKRRTKAEMEAARAAEEASAAAPAAKEISNVMPMALPSLANGHPEPPQTAPAVAPSPVDMNHHQPVRGTRAGAQPAPAADLTMEDDSALYGGAPAAPAPDSQPAPRSRRTARPAASAEDNFPAPSIDNSWL